MLFSSVIFICFFLPVAILGNYILSFSRTAQNIFLLVISLFFYAWGEPVYILIMLASIFMNYIFAIIIDKSNRHKVKKTILTICVTYNLFILFIFKYLGFVVRNINSLCGRNIIPVPAIALPIGISFFTFQALSYVVDVYRDDAKVEKNILYLGLYISFFPQLIAGPIVRYNSVAEQIRTRKININKFSAGCSRFAIGFAKKILLANNFAIIVDRIYGAVSGGESVAVMTAWVGAVGYILQLFFDFSAYSDMAIGLGLMFGFKFDENFNYPFVAKSVSEFWRRWHISLTTWFRSYVYFPLGGSRVDNKDKIIRNIFVVWLLTGIWHGAEWTFVFWGLWNFVFIFLEKLFKFEENNRIPAWLKHIYLLFIIIIGFVPFRAVNMNQGIIYLANMFKLSGNAFYSSEAVMYIREYWIYWLGGILFSTPFAKYLEKILVDSKSRIPAILGSIVYPVGLMILFIISFSALVRGSYNPFIYFNF